MSCIAAHLLIESLCFWELLLETVQLGEVVACPGHMGVIFPKACLGFLQSPLQVPLRLHQLLLQNVHSGSVLFVWNHEAGGCSFEGRKHGDGVGGVYARQPPAAASADRNQENTVICGRGSGGEREEGWGGGGVKKAAFAGFCRKGKQGSMCCWDGEKEGHDAGQRQK